MSAQFPGSYNPGPARYGAPQGPMGGPTGYGAPPGPMGGPTGYRAPPGPVGVPNVRGPVPVPGANMYNGPGQYAAPPTAQMKQGMPLGAVQNGPQNDPPPGPQGDVRFGAPRGPAPGPPRPQPGQMPRPPISMGGGGPMMRGPPPPGHMAGGPGGQIPPTSQMTNQFGGMTVTDHRGPPPPSGGGAPPPPTSGPAGFSPMNMGPPQGHSQGGGLPPPGMGPPSSAMGPPTSGMGPPTSGMGMPVNNMGPPPAMGPPSSGMGMSMNSMGPPPSSMPPQSMGPPKTSMGMPQSNMGQPQTSMPPVNMGHPPSSMGNMPPSGSGPQSPGFSPSPTSGPPPTSGFGQASMNMGAPPMGQNIPPGGFSQPPGPGGFPPPGPGNMPQSSQYGGYGAPPGSGMPPTSAGQFPGGSTTGQGFGQQAFPYGGVPGQRPSAQPQQPRRLDPDQMPSPIQVIEDDRKSHSGLFQTNAKGTVPPLVTTNFVAQDGGNSNPRFVRSTMYNIPCTADMLKSSHIPFALAITPFAKLQDQEQEPPLVDLGELGPVRCKRCKSYMSPFMQFIDGGRRFQCVFCGCATDVPAEYFAHLDHTGRRVDCYNRPELCLGSYEFTATKDYCKNGVDPKEPAFIFMIDVSYNSVKSGLVQLICDKLKSDILVNLPKETGADESEIRVGFVTYGKELHFYNVKSALAQPQMLVVSDLEDMFVPLLDGFLVKLSESETVIDSLLSQIPQLFAESRETETVLGPVIQAGLDALRSADRSGKLYIFHTSLPIAEAPGKLKNRDDRKLLGTEKEKTLLTPQNNFYTKLGQDCVAAGCSVDLFLFPNAYLDVASMADVCRLTGGNIYKYSYFQADLDGERFIEDLKRNITRPMAFDAILRVRTSTGIRPVDFYGNFYMANTTDVELAAIDCDQSISVEIKHDDKLSESEGAYVQIAVLFTSITGQRRLRVLNLAMNCCTQMADLFRSCELDVLINYMAKHAIRNQLNTNPKQVREYIMNEVAQILGCYRKNCASPSSAGQLILPECMKLLPLYANCVVKNDGIQGGSEISTDDRSYLIHLINSMDVKSSNVFFYPRLLPLHDLDLDSKQEPVAVRCSVDRLQDSGIYLLENGLSMFLWIGHSVDPEWIQKIFGVQSAAQVDIDKCQLLDLDNPISRRICDIIKKTRDQSSRFLKLTIVRQRDKLEPWFNHFLVEDKGLNGSASYVDFLCHIHKEIRNILN